MARVTLLLVCFVKQAGTIPYHCLPEAALAEDDMIGVVLRAQEQPSSPIITCIAAAVLPISEEEQQKKK